MGEEGWHGEGRSRLSAADRRGYRRPWRRRRPPRCQGVAPRPGVGSRSGGRPAPRGMPRHAGHARPRACTPGHAAPRPCRWKATPTLPRANGHRTLVVPNGGALALLHRALADPDALAVGAVAERLVLHGLSAPPGGHCACDRFALLVRAAGTDVLEKGKLMMTKLKFDQFRLCPIENKTFRFV